MLNFFVLSRSFWSPVRPASPAADYVERELDLNEYSIRHPAATSFIRASGKSMSDIGLRDGDLMVVDRTETPRHGDIVIAALGSESTVKQLRLSAKEPRVTLQSMNPEFSPIYPDPDTLQIFGAVTVFLHKCVGISSRLRWLRESARHQRTY